jgi:predicted ATP-dependent protease
VTIDAELIERLVRELAERTAERDKLTAKLDDYAQLCRDALTQLDAARAECAGLRQALGAAQRELATRGTP